MSTLTSQPPRTLLRRNFRALYADIFGYGILAGSTLAFINVYVARLGASNIEMGLLSAGPALISLLIAMPIGRWLERRPLIRTTYLSSIGFRLGYVVMVLLPWFLPPPAQIGSYVLLVLLMSIPGTALAIGFNATLAATVPPDWRAHVIGRRNALMSLSMTATSLLSGQLLDHIVFPLNYQLVFGIGVAGAAMSTIFLGRIKPIGPIGSIGSQIPASARLGNGNGRGRALRLDLLRGPFGLMMIAYLFFYLGQAVPVPLFAKMQVDQLKLSDGVISVGTAAFNGCMLIGSLYLARLTRRFGHRGVFAIAALLYGAYPLLLGLAENNVLFFAASILGGAITGVMGGAQVNRLMERIPNDDLPAHMALNNMAGNIALLTGSMLGPLLADALGLREAILISAALRVLAGIALVRWA
ncbi:MAG: MFS transporter [Chloroflexi bacterium]|nr:MFS transporter [Chloroflexota bacterium]